MIALPISRKEAAEELLRRRIARRSFLDFVRFIWWNPQEFIVGKHTLEICERVDQAVDDYILGFSSFLILAIPFRHGKSDLVSRALPPYFLGRLAADQPDVILSGYGAELVESFSRKNKSIINSRPYQILFPEVRLSSTKNAVNKWAIEGSVGEVTVAGLGGGLTGHGGRLLVLDDYCKKREEAESKTYRNKVWESFTDDFMTRRGDPAVVIVCATPWNVDDVIGRIGKKMEEDPSFPPFEVLRFPARSEDYPSGYLFPERFSEDWYLSQYATLGKYASAGLLDCNPKKRGGSLFQVDGIKVLDREKFPKDIRYFRFWDLASSEKERVSDDPDYTAGAEVGLAYPKGPDGPPELWVRDLVLMLEEAPLRDRRISATSAVDDPGVMYGVEQVGVGKDAVKYIKALLQGKRVVVGIKPSGDKVVRASPLEAIFEAGNVFLARSSKWNEAFIDQFLDFPRGDHDDIVDAVSGGYLMATKYRTVAVDPALRRKIGG